jgi:outer membrane protein TolC
LSGLGLAQYQSQVTTIPLTLPGFSIPTPSHETYDARVNVQQSLYDATIAPRRTVEQDKEAESESQLRTTLYGLRGDVNTAFFTAMSSGQQAIEMATTITDLEARLTEARNRVQQGTSLPSDTSTIEATILQRRQDAARIAADRRAALATLSALVGHAVTEQDLLALPDGDADVTRARTALDAQRTRPEYAHFADTRQRLDDQAAVDAAQRRPNVSAFGRLGYGRPGLNPLNANFGTYWLAGVQVQWNPWDWGTTGRDRESLALQREIALADEAAFTDALHRGVQSDLATIDRLDSALVFDSQIVLLREQVERETAVRLQEGVITAAEYVDRSTDLLAARLTRDQHRIDLAQARAHFLTSLGIEIH